jgi:hypothetical protein
LTGSNGQTLVPGALSSKNLSESNAQQTAQTQFDPVEATRQIKNVIGIGQGQHQQQQQLRQQPDQLELQQP